MNDRELASLEAAARQYRVQVYETYRLDRAEFDRRRAAGDQVQARWREAGGRKEDLGAILKWFELATYLSQPEVRQSLPAFPALGVFREIAPTSEADAPETIAPPPPRGAIEPYVQRRPPPAPRVSGYQIAPPRQFVPPATSHSVVTPPSARLPARPQGGPAPSVAQPRVGRALLPAPWEVVTPAASQSTADVGAVQRRGGEIEIPPTPTRVEHPSRVAGVVKAPQSAVTAVAPDASAASQLNVGELLARASGYGFGLRTIDSLLDEQASLDAAELASLLSELEALVEQRRDLLLYEQLVSADVRQRMLRALDSPKTTVAALGSRIAAARERLTQEAGLAASEREVRLQALADLSRRLSRLSQ